MRGVDVRIPRVEADNFENGVLRGQVVLNRLRAAGIPALGVLCLVSVERGVLRMWLDEMFDDYVFSWSDAAE
jgi:hypothetical protein